MYYQKLKKIIAEKSQVNLTSNIGNHHTSDTDVNPLAYLPEEPLGNVVEGEYREELYRNRSSMNVWS